MDSKTDAWETKVRKHEHGEQETVGKKVKRMMIKPLLDIKCIYEPYCDYPVALKITMMNGTVQVYELKNKTEYQFDKVFEALEKLTVGYQYHEPIGKHERKIKPW